MTPERIAELRAFVEGAQDAKEEGIPVDLSAELAEALDALEMVQRARDTNHEAYRMAFARVQELEAALEQARKEATRLEESAEQYRHGLLDWRARAEKAEESARLAESVANTRGVALEMERAKVAKLRGKLETVSAMTEAHAMEPVKMVTALIAIGEVARAVLEETKP